ncbi:hypothetical protein GGR32_000280 [Mesonia hippocampi]|uniref:DUF4199 domain-containing protein n=1 Tax=Mesonia hippocampi TaxID=1628250 RepID=A0A840EIL8_9FLAO|nr:DUF4199 domain-containing protein [Mesonia hippocampi]MBB4118008.1 hypothetical protein [Mesonia hippocampi]
MEPQKPTPLKSIAYSFGGILAIYSMALLVFIYSFEIKQQHWSISLVNILSYVLIFGYAIQLFKQKNKGYLSMQETLKVGLAVAVIGGLLSAIYAFFHYSFVDAGYQTAILEDSLAQMEKQNLSEVDKENALEFTKLLTSPFFMGTITLLQNLFFGFIISLVVGLALKKEKPNN